jgi:hypothetical protein
VTKFTTRTAWLTERAAILVARNAKDSNFDRGTGRKEEIAMIDRQLRAHRKSDEIERRGFAVRERPAS